jgi:MIP family channel proteins
MQDRGIAAYVTELVGTLLLVFVITTVVTLYVSVGGAQVQFGSDFVALALAHGLVLFALIATLAGVSGGHFNPAVTLAAWALRRIDSLDAIVYMLAQLAGGVLGALLTKALLLDEGRAGNYGAVQVSDLLSGLAAGALVEAIGTFFLVLAVISVALNPRAWRDWAPLVIGFTLAFLILVFGPLTGASVNPARWFGPALISDEFGGTWPYLLGPVVGAFAAVAFYRFVIEPGEQGGERQRAPGT